MKFKKSFTYLIGLVTLFGFGAVGVLIIDQVHDRSLMDVLQDGEPISLQITVGILYGFASSLIALEIIHSDFFTPVREFFSNLFHQNLSLRIGDVLFLSLCAGIGEELLFRGGIQPLLGIWLTAFVFILLHGYINPTNWRLTIYGGIMVFISAGLGYLYDHIGLISAMTAHAVLDIILFLVFLYRYRS